MNADESGGGGLHPDELDRYSWQQSVAGFGVDGQRRLKAAGVLVSRVGGVGGAAATYLAAAGVGRLVLAHAGNLRRNDLNRQTLMSTPGIGRPRVEQAAERFVLMMAVWTRWTRKGRHPAGTCGSTTT